MNKNTISKWFSMFVLMMVAGITGATAQSLTVADFSIEQGATKEVAINLTPATEQTIYGIQTDIVLSEGLSLVDASANETLTLAKNTLTGGATRVALYSQAGASIPAGDVITIKVKAAENFAAGTIALTNSKLTTSTAGAEINVENSTANVTKAEPVAPVIPEGISYSWESPAGKPIEWGGTIAYVNGDGNRLNYLNSGYYTICLNGKKVNLTDTVASANAGKMVVTLDKAVAEGDTIAYTAYITKDKSATAAAYILFENGTNVNGAEFGDAANIHTNFNGVPQTDVIVVPAGAAGSKTITLTRGQTGTNLFITKLQIIKKKSVPVTATFNFAAEGFREKVGTSLTDVDGIVYNETFTADGATLQVTSGSAASKLYFDTNRGQNLVTYPQYATLTFKAPEGKAIVQIDFTAAGNSNINKLTPSSGAVEGMVWTGNAEGVRFAQGGTSYLANAILTIVDKTTETAALPAIEYTECANIAAFNALEAGTYAKITLTNAEVIGKSADGYSTVWMQDATGGCWIQYTSLNDKLTEKTKVNGTIYTIKRETSGNPQMKEAEATLQSELNATAIESYTAIVGTIAEVNVAANLNKVVKIAADSLLMTSATAGTLYVGEKSISVNNGTATANQQLHKIADWEKGKKLENITIVAILSATSATANQLFPISIEETEVEPEDTYAIVKMTYVDGAEEQANTVFGEVEVAKAGFNKIENGQVAMANTGWGCNWITYLNVDASAFKGIVKKAVLTAEVSGSTDNKRTTTWGVGYNSSAWAADTTYNTADKSITVIGEPWTGSTQSSETFQEVSFDITEAFAKGNVATILVYETAAAGGYIKNPKVLVEMGWPEIEKNGIIYAVKSDNLFTNGSFDEGVTGWKTIGYTTDAVASDFTISNEGGYDGGAFITTNGAGVGSEKTIRQSVAVTEGKTYYFAVRTSGKAPAANNFNYNALFKMTDAATEDGVIKAFEWPQGADQTATEWSTTEHVFTAESGFVGVRMGWNQNSSFDGFELYELEMLTSALDAAKATKIAAIDALAPIGEGLFFYSQRSIDDAKAAVNAAETVEAVEAVAMPTPTVPAADKEYTFFNKQAQLYLTLSAEGISIAEEPYNLKFEAAEGGKYYVTDGTNYIGIAGTDNWSMATAADKKEALTISATLVGSEAYYTLAESKGLVGVDYPKKDNMGCWANKGTGDGDAVLWSIAEKKDRFAITIAETQNGTAVAKPTTAAEGETVTLIATPAEGYMVDKVNVTYGENQEVELNKNATADTITFVMPASAVTATFTFKLTPIATAKAALEATLAAAKAIETEGKNGADALNAAITPAETALTAADATVESLTAAKEALAQAISVFNKANLDADLVEIAQNQGKDLDTFTRTDLVEGAGYNTYTANGDLNIAIKMVNVDVKDCDYVVIKFAEPVAAGWHLAFWSNQDLVDVPAGATEFKYVFADDPKCGVSAEGVLPQICMMTFFGGFQAPLEAKIVGIYKHNTVIATGINTIANDAQKNTIFNLNGQKVNKAQRGLYIINGKRVMVK